MPNPSEPQKFFLHGPPGAYILQGDVEFEGLAAPVGKEIVRIRFSQGHRKTLDIPLSADSFARLVRVMRSLHGDSPSELASSLEELRQTVGLFDD